MANSKISALTSATTPLAGSETLPIVQSGATTKVTVDNLTAGKTVYAKNVDLTAGRLFLDQDYQVTWRNGGTNRGRIYVDSGNTIGFENGSGNTTRMLIDNSGNVTFSTGNLVQGTAAKGINFTANTPAAGMTSQLLNWYEEGTYTPAFTADSGTAPSVGNGTLTGAYTRIGRLVQTQIKLVLGSTTTMGNGGVLQFGLLFSASSSAGATGTAYIDDTGTGWTIGFPTLRTSTTIDISLAVPGTIGTTRVTNTAPMTWATGDSIVISFVYFV